MMTNEQKCSNSKINFQGVTTCLSCKKKSKTVYFEHTNLSYCSVYNFGKYTIFKKIPNRRTIIFFFNKRELLQINLKVMLKVLSNNVIVLFIFKRSY